MFKRANKITALLVAAAAIVSLVPTGVMAADEVKSEKGQIYDAIAYKDGNFYIGGKPSSKDDAAYYLADGKYTKLKDIGSEDKAEEYGTKYVEIRDGEYYVDLSSGKVSDEKLKEKHLDEVSLNLKSKVKSDNDGRYDEADAKVIKDLTKIPGNKFGEEWYETKYNAKKIDDTINGGADKFNVYTNKDGKYIDADYNLGKIRVKLSNGKISTVENTSNADKDVRGSVTDAKVIGQDSNSIYRLAKVTVKSTVSGATITEVNGVELDADSTNLVLSADKTSVSFDVIQVISKAQGSKEVNGIKSAKSTSTYALSDKDGKKIDLLNSAETAFTVVSGKLINYEINGDKLEAQTISLKSKSSVYYIEKSDDDHVTLQDGENSVDVDVDGNLWALSDSNIYKFDNDEDFEKIYKTEKEYSNLSVYDKNNIVLWNSNEEIYSIIGSKKAETTDTNSNTNTNTTATTQTTTTTTTTTPTSPSVTSGWVKDSNNKWSYTNADSTKFKGWLPFNGSWYYLDNDGIMVTGWKNINNNWYFLDSSSGAMRTGWIEDGSSWYYCNELGIMLLNTYVGGFKLGPSGAWVK